MDTNLNIKSGPTIRGFFGIGIWQPKHDVNVGGLFRSAFCFDAGFTFTIGRKYRRQSSDTPDCAKHIPHYNYLTTENFLEHLPKQARLVCVELDSRARPLERFIHPEQAVYILGSEAQTLPEKILSKGTIVQVATRSCLNVATCSALVMYDRQVKRLK